MKKAGNSCSVVIWDRVDYMERAEQLPDVNVYWKVKILPYSKNFRVKIIKDLLGSSNHMFKLETLRLYFG